MYTYEFRKRLNNKEHLQGESDMHLFNASSLFTEENIKSVRPAIGIAPKYYYDLIGKKAKNNYEFGDPIQLCEVK